MDYRYLKAFEATARNLNFTQAARELRISPSALSRQIALLESSVGSELLIRSTRRVLLTPEGERLFQSVKRFESELNQSRELDPLRIGCLQSVFEFFLSKVIQESPEAFGGPLEIIIGSPEELEERAHRGELDLILTNREPARGSTLSALKLFRERVGWTGNRKDPAARPILFTAFESHYPEAALKDPRRIRVNSFHAAVLLAKNGIGRTLVAVPVRGTQGKRAQAGSQWIYAVTPAYRQAPERQKRAWGKLKKAAAQFES